YVWEAARNPNNDFELVPGEEKHHFSDSVFKVVDDAKSGWDYHSSFVNFYIHIPAPYVTRMLKGDMTPEAATQKIYEECQPLL
ncbi:MAG: hypothetical protein ABEK12_03990, partial [Candidatus Nanohaloarchaea archaeon]